MASVQRYALVAQKPNFRDWVGEEFAIGLREMDVFAPNDIQNDAIPLGLSGNDVMVAAQTGSGKTLMFLLPILYRLSRKAPLPESSPKACDCSPEALIIVPSDELALQVMSVARKLVAALPDSFVIECIVESSGKTTGYGSGVRLVISTPQALVCCIRQGAFGRERLSMVAVDEADAVLCTSSEMVRDANEILHDIEERKDPVQFFLTMSHLSDEREAELVKRFPHVQRVSQTGVLVPTLRQCYHYFRGDKEAKLVFVLNSADSWLRAGTTLVFCASSQEAARLFTFLQTSALDWKPVALHDDMQLQERTASVQAFRDGDARLLVATDAVMRGLDFPDLRHVIMYDMPSDITAFVHSAGRTARRGQSGLVTCMVQTHEGQVNHFDYKDHHGLADAPALSFPSEELPAATS
jgi:ATP-dependent RNA helicase DeaD